jgi:hypothetical protein
LLFHNDLQDRACFINRIVWEKPAIAFTHYINKAVLFPKEKISMKNFLLDTGLHASDIRVYFRPLLDVQIISVATNKI